MLLRRTRRKRLWRQAHCGGYGIYQNRFGVWKIGNFGNFGYFAYNISNGREVYKGNLQLGKIGLQTCRRSRTCQKKIDLQQVQLLVSRRPNGTRQMPKMRLLLRKTKTRFRKMPNRKVVKEKSLAESRKAFFRFIVLTFDWFGLK